MLFSKLSEGLKEHLNALLHFEYIKVIVVGINELVLDCINPDDGDALQIAASQHLEFNFRGLKPRQFIQEYKRCIKLFQIKPRNKEIIEYIEKEQAKS